MIPTDTTIETPSSSLALVEPDVATWDSFVRAHPAGSLLQLAGWGTLKAKFGWQVRRLALTGPNGIQAGAQVLFKGRLGLQAAYVPRGPLFSGDQAIDQMLLRALEVRCRRQRSIFLRIEPPLIEGNQAADRFHSMLLVADFRTAAPLQPRSTVQLDLRPEPERLLAAMSKGHRADIRRAAREGVNVRVGTSEADLDAFYSIMQSTSARAEFGIHSRDYYATVWQTFAATGEALLLLAEHEGTAIATALVCADGHSALYLYSGSTEDGLKYAAQHAIQWQALQWARERGCAMYDFWGIPDHFGVAATVRDVSERDRLLDAAKDDPLHGVYRFKKGFGGQVIRFLPAYDRVFIPALYQLWLRRMG